MMENNSKFPDFLNQDVDIVAKKLLGCILRREIDGEVIVVRIVETESYDQNDEASHAYGGKTVRNEVMFGEAGHLYVYFIYGMHYCCNIVTGKKGFGSGVLIRAVEPIKGLHIIENGRGAKGVNVTNGPAKTCKSLAIDFELRGHDLRLPPLQLFTANLRRGEVITATTRVGITKARNIKRRHYIKGNPYVSREH